ncbi:MAG TPA: methyltransferase domain-containing protein [Longimicrobiales bacterium]|nr:methyltransferase domain-containing protein [Longimicrobiales bacterium]
MKSIRAAGARVGPGASFPPGGEALYRHIARLVDLGPPQEFVVVPCGTGTTADFLCALTGAAGAGVDPDPERVEMANARVRVTHHEERLHFDAAPVTDLPYRDGVFDVAVGELGLAAAGDPAAAVRELVRVTRPLGTVVLVQLAWDTRVDPRRERMLVEHLGVRPFLQVEWKQMLRAAGVVDLHVEDWTEAAEALLTRGNVLGGLAEPGAPSGTTGIVARALRWLGLRRLRYAFGRAKEVRRLIVRERVLGLTLIKGTRWDESAPAPT